MSTDSLNLEYLRNQATALVKSARLGETKALARIAPHLPAARSASKRIALADAQRTIAREHGFSNWTRLKHAALASDSNPVLSRFATTALDDYAEAERMLETNQDLREDRGLLLALLTGNSRRIRTFVEANEDFAIRSLGPRGWAPLLYVCNSRFASPKSSRAGFMAAAARVLLEHGADPSTFYMPKEWPDNPLSCLFGATGLNNNPKLANVLIEYGANLNDSESVYHSLEHPDLICLNLLLKSGADVNQPAVIFHAMDREDPKMVATLLKAGANLKALDNDRKQTALHQAVWRGRSAAVLQLLINGGVELNVKRDDGRTAYAMAYLSGQAESVKTLQEAGADTTLSDLDRAIGDCAMSDNAEIDPAVKWLLAKDKGADRALADLAMGRRTTAVIAMLKAGANVNARGESGATALHWACWHAYSDVVRVLLSVGASLTVRDNDFKATPIGWFSHGIFNCPDRSGDWPDTARALIEAGAELETYDNPTGVPGLDEVLAT